MKKAASFLRRAFLFVLIVLGIALVTTVLGLAALWGIIVTSFDGNAEFPADCAVVFGAAVYGNAYPGPAIIRRVRAAADLQRDGSVTRLILSGGKGIGNRQSEAEVMLKVALEQGVPEEAMTLEQESHSTWENLAFSRPLTSGCTSTIAISDRYHLARIRLLAWRQGWENLQTYPAEKPEAASERRSLIREMAGYTYYLLWMDQWLPDDIKKNLESKIFWGSKFQQGQRKNPATIACTPFMTSYKMHYTKLEGSLFFTPLHFSA